ncbi:MAG: AI-2E family transporter [Prevotellaceae bacterium]|jgi:predicted PurR-regulated permease PerM|nr:AI-2E family transporter [Prevotellaceae bacterium]
MNRLARYIIIIAVIAIVLFTAWYFSNIIIYILIASVLSIIGRPIVNFFDRIRVGKYFCPHWLGAALSLAAIFFAIVMFLYTFIPLISSQLQELSSVNISQLVEQISKSMSGLEQQINKLIPGKESFSLNQFLAENLTSYFNFSSIGSIFGSVANMIINFLIAIFCIFFITFFFLKEDSLLLTGITVLFPKKYEENITRVLKSINTLLMRYFIGMLIEITCVMTVLVAGLTLFGGLKFSTAMVIALSAGILNVIPYVGPLVGGVLTVIVSLATDATFITTGNIGIIVPIVIIFVIVQLVDNIVFQPLIYSNSVKSHPLENFIVLLVAGNIAGILGMLVAIPAYTVIRVFAKEFLYSFRLVQKLTENI